MMRRILVQFILLLIFYLLIVDKFVLPEIIAGCLICIIAVAAAEVARRRGGVIYAHAAGGWSHFVRLPIQVVTDTGRVFFVAAYAAAGRKGIGRFLHVPFDPGGDDPASASRRSLVVGGMSVTPNAIAVRIEAEERRLLVHQLAKAPPPGKGDAQWPI